MKTKRTKTLTTAEQLAKTERMIVASHKRREREARETAAKFANVYAMIDEIEAMRRARGA